MALVLAAACGGGAETYGANTPTDLNVLLVTLDGVRWQEFFGETDPLLTPEPRALFPLFWSRIAPRGRAYGNPREGSETTVATIANASLPGYASLFAEQDQGCLTNFCGRIEVPTFLDRLRDELLIPQKGLAVVASWPKLSLAVTGRDDVAVIQAGGYDLTGEASHPQAALLEESLEMDRGTVLQGLQYLEEHRPRFLYLSFWDSDRYGHQNNYPRYLDVLAAYDRLLSTLVDRLDAAGDYGRKTALLVTTDHGRGLWDQWMDHGPQTPASGRIFAFVMLPPDATGMKVQEVDARVFTHHDVRYSIETLFGLSTRGSSGFSTGFIVQDEPVP